YMGLCPFHNEKTPSFHVSREKQLYHCFGCGASGNLIRYVMNTENLDFVDAVKLLADNAGIVIPDDGEISTESHNKKKKILEMNKMSARFYHNCLKSKDGTTAREYFSNRKIQWKTVITYGLGYAPANKTSLLNFLKDNDYTENELLEAGLAVNRDGKIIDKFRNRVMFPIINVRGEIIGFGGRIMGNEKEINGYKIPKYLNSSETAAFDKGKNLFSLNLAKNSAEQSLILCEGYMDVIATYQAGVKNIVATLGTAITINQAKLMRRYANEIIICYDSDEAGIKAALRAIDVINEAGGKSRVIRLKGAKDPDEYINKYGIEKFREAVKKSLPSTEYRLSLIKSKYDTTTPDGKIKFLDEAVGVFLSIKDSIEVEAYINKVSDETGISKNAIYAKCREKGSGRKTYAKPKQSRVTAERPDGTKQVVPPSIIEAEKRLLSLIVGSKKYYAICKENISPNEFMSDIHKRLAEKIYTAYESGTAPEEAMILNNFSASDKEMNEASSVFYNMEVYNGDTAVIYDLIYTIKEKKIQMQIDNETNISAIGELIKQKQDLINKKKQWEET
ncbi:MAG: DNA primase, partial [Firmicutes bacterium]|nr:DNA primase [Bacillota bacterium]